MAFLIFVISISRYIKISNLINCIISQQIIHKGKLFTLCSYCGADATRNSFRCTDNHSYCVDLFQESSGQFLVFHVALYLLCTVVRLSIFSQGILSSFSMYEFECHSSIYRLFHSKGLMNLYFVISFLF